jgi:Ribonuclease G/E
VSGATLLIERSPGETRAALLRDGTTLQVDHYRDHEPPLEGAVFHGRVRRIEPGLNAAFVALDGAREGFLRARAIAGRPRGATIDGLVQEGAALLVRVIGEAPEQGDKLLRLATLDATARHALTAGKPLPPAPACVDPGAPPVARILDEHAAVAPRIVCNAGAVKRAAEDWLGTHDREAVVEQGAFDLFAEYGVDAAIDAALATCVDLPGGARIIFEPGETLCAIDIDTGARSRAAARDVNMAALPEIARQLRLREIAGAVVIDFLKLDRPDERDALLAALRAALACDPAECHVLGMTRLGLVELTRRRRRRSLSARLMAPAATPAPRADTVACMLLREIATRSHRGRGGFEIVAAPAVVHLLGGAMAGALAESLAWSHAKATLRADPALPKAQFEVRETAVDAEGQA